MIQFSTGLVNGRAKDKSMKELLHDGVLRIYSGVQPANADAALTTGILLCEITYQGGVFTAGVKSTRKKDTVTITAGNEGDSYKIVINGTTYTHVMTAGQNETQIAAALATLIDVDEAVSAVSSVGVVIVRAKFGGVTFTIANTGSTTPGNVVIASVTANVRENGIQFGSAALGVLSKESGAWTGLILASGQAGYARFLGNASDNGGVSTTLVRIDGTCGTSVNADFQMATLNLIIGRTLTVDSFTITEPQVRA